jgi:hypothetical protein
MRELIKHILKEETIDLSQSLMRLFEKTLIKQNSDELCSISVEQLGKHYSVTLFIKIGVFTNVREKLMNDAWNMVYDVTGKSSAIYQKDCEKKDNIREETDQVEDNKLSLKNKLKTIRDNFGIEHAIKITGGLENYVKIFFNSNLKDYYKESGIEPYRISSEPNLFIDDLIVQSLELPDVSPKEKSLYNFVWESGGTKYRFTARLYLVEYASGIKMWRVVGSSGDSGFGYSYITKKNTLGKRARMQIFKQVIDKLKLDDYK